MCYICDKFGDPNVGGGLWYLNPKNLARNMYKLRSPGEAPSDEFRDSAEGTKGPAELVAALEEGLDKVEQIRQRQIANARRAGRGSQIVPLAEALQMMDLMSPVAIIGCDCRKSIRGIDERNEEEYSCMALGAGMFKWERWPERYKGGIKFLNAEEAKEWMRKMDKRGYVHTLMGSPLPTGFCQCHYPECISTRNAVEFGVGSVRSHYVAMVDRDECNGCRICVQRCQFGALKFEVFSEKANIDPFLCYGCGLCHTACPRKAIELVARKTLPALAEVW